MRTKVIVQILGQCLVAALAYYWLGIGVGSYAQLALNAGLALVLILALAALDAYGLGNVRHTLWALPSVFALALLAWKLSAMPALALLWLTILLPSAASARWRFHAQPRYLGTGIAILALSALPAAALVFWVPSLQGLGPEAASFALRFGCAAIFLYGGWALLLDFVRRETLAPKTEDPLPPVTADEPLRS